MGKISKDSFVIYDDLRDILMFLDYNSNILYDKVRSGGKNGQYFLIRKYLTHSDLSNVGKSTKTKKLKVTGAEYVKRFILYYDSAMSLTDNRKLPTAAQSCIGLPKEFHEITGIKTYLENGKKQYVFSNDWLALLPIDAVTHYNLLDFDKIRAYNNKAKFSSRIQDEVDEFDVSSYIYEEEINFYKFDELTIAAHGLGVVQNKLLTYLRRISFKGDVLNILVDIKTKTLYLFFERNEKYFELLSKIANLPIAPPIWEEYTDIDKKNVTLVLYALNRAKAELIGEPFLDEACVDQDEIDTILESYYDEYNKKLKEILDVGIKPKYRWYQSKWREVLIKLDEVSFHAKGYAVCALSNLKGKYEKLGGFFIASHIKPYAQCITESDYKSAFDPHNGLMLSANADALFDRHLVSIDVDHDGIILKKEVVNSISRIKSVIAKDKIDDIYLTDKRKEYLRIHKAMFDIIE